MHSSSESAGVGAAKTQSGGGMWPRLVWVAPAVQEIGRLEVLTQEIGSACFMHGVCTPEECAIEWQVGCF